jgi:hypothetical protein
MLQIQYPEGEMVVSQCKTTATRKTDQDDRFLKSDREVIYGLVSEV